MVMEIMINAVVGFIALVPPVHVSSICSMGSLYLLLSRSLCSLPPLSRSSSTSSRPLSLCQIGLR